MSVERDVSPGLHLFEGYGVELEYMIVDRASGAVAPLSDRLLETASGTLEPEIERGELAWSNELVLHAIELKTNGPAPELAPLADLFTRGLREMDRMLEPMGARLWPTAMHPLMQPERDTKLWPHDYGDVYRAFDRIFDCRGHGWSNLQSTHLNLPFQGAEEFGQLHTAIRVLLPLLPALAASSPVVEGRVTGLSDNRLEFYRNNCARLPVVTGHVVPEAVESPDEYTAAILDPIARAIEPLDPDEVLEAEWVNARGAIARLERESIEIRVLDVQEHAAADLGIIALAVALLKGLVEERWAPREAQHALSTGQLEAVLLSCVRQGSSARINDGEYLAVLGVEPKPVSARALWQKLYERALGSGLLARRLEWTRALSVILEQGTLSDRIVARLGDAPTRETILKVWDELGACLLAGEPFGGAC